MALAGNFVVFLIRLNLSSSAAAITSPSLMRQAAASWKDPRLINGARSMSSRERFPLIPRTSMPRLLVFRVKRRHRRTSVEPRDAVGQEHGTDRRQGLTSIFRDHGCLD